VKAVIELVRAVFGWVEYLSPSDVKLLHSAATFCHERRLPPE
jgi:hypothetical protein